MTKDENSSNNRYRKLVEMEAEQMSNFSDRLGNLEIHSASTTSEIRSLFNAVKAVSDKLDTMDSRNRPNTLAMFSAAFGACALIATIGVLAFSPVYRALDSGAIVGARMQNAIDGIISTRFTPDDARYLKETHDKDLGVITSAFSGRMGRNESLLIDTIERTARLEGSVYQPHSAQ